MESIIQILARELGRKEAHIQNVVDLIDQGNTIPFIARYRKELHGAMDDTALRTLADRLQYLRNLDKRREEVKAAIEGQGKLTEELSAAIDAAATLAEVEDLYRPYKPKRRTRATVAREKGLEPLAQLLYAQEGDGPAPEDAAGDYVDRSKGVESVEDALQGASDIIAEWISDDADIRKNLRELVWRKGYLVSAAAPMSAVRESTHTVTVVRKRATPLRSSLVHRPCPFSMAHPVLSFVSWRVYAPPAPPMSPGKRREIPCNPAGLWYTGWTRKRRRWRGCGWCGSPPGCGSSGRWCRCTSTAGFPARRRSWPTSWCSAFSPCSSASTPSWACCGWT